MSSQRCRSRARLLAVLVLFVSWGVVRPGQTHAAEPRSVSVIYYSDLLHPHDDPDDHFDLATLFAVPEFHILGVVLDLGDRQAQRPGATPLRQMMAITRRQVPHATALAEPLRSPEDDGATQPETGQGGVRLILDSLRRARGPVTIIQTGSLRDIAAALNREPQLLRAKVAAVYVNSGNGAAVQDEWNVKLDPQAYRRVMTSGLPIHWCPCFGEDGYATHWRFRQGAILDRVAAPVRAYLVYALIPLPVAVDPVAAVRSPWWGRLVAADWQAATWAAERSMWSTVSLLHAAGRRVYGTGDDEWEALGDEEAGRRGLGPESASRSFAFEPVTVTIDEQRNLKRIPAGNDSAMRVFHAPDPQQYAREMQSCLGKLLGSLGR